MRKIRSNSKRKWIVGGVMFFASAALITTGFATWVIGTTVLDKKEDIGVDVQTAVNESVTMSATLTKGESLHIGEMTTAGSAGDIVTVKDGKATDFDVVFSEVLIQCGTDYYTDHFADHDFKLTLKANEASEAAGNVLANNKVSDNKLDKAGKVTKWRSGSEWTYLDLSEKTNNVTFASAKWSLESGIHKCTLTDVKFTFGWGSFFGGFAPTKFYNDHKADLVDDLGKINAIKEELIAMEAAFTASPKAVLPFVLTLVPYTAPAAPEM